MNIVGLREHSFNLNGKYVALRPMMEYDWDTILKWETDPDVLYWSDGNPDHPRTPEKVRYIFRTVSQRAYCFIIEYKSKPIGDCWLQEMNVKPIIKKFPGKDCRRIDLVIGEKGLWGKGLGTDTILTLTKFAFMVEEADIIFGLPFDYNARSRKAFEKAGYSFLMKMEEPPGSRAKYVDVLAISQPASR